MKLLIVINNLGVGGAERLVIDDIHELKKRGHDVYLLTLKLENPERTLSDELMIAPDRWIRIDFGSLLNIASWVKVIRSMRGIRPDALITHLWYSNVIGRIAGKISGVRRIVVFEHNVYDTLKTRKMFFIDRLFQSWAHTIVAVSKAVRASLLRHGIRPERVRVIMNGIDTSKFIPISRENTPEKTGNSAPIIFIFVGRLIKAKGVDILLSAFASTKDARLIIVGDGAGRTDYERLANELGLENRVSFLGVRHDIPSLLASSDCFVLPSRYEGLPMVLLEAIAARKPVIVSDFESASEIVSHGVNGLIVPREDEKALAQALNTISSDAHVRATLIKGSEGKISSISIVRHVDALLDLFK